MGKAAKGDGDGMTFHEFLADLGLMPPADIIPGDSYRRCPTLSHPRKKNGSFKLTADGKAGFAIDFASMTTVAVWRSGDTADGEGIDFAALAERNAQRKGEEAESSAKAARYFEQCKPLTGSHPYLIGKGCDMRGCHGLRVDEKGALVIPMYRGGKLISVQRISADGGKLFWSGAPTKGAFYPLRRDGATISILCEGLATGLTLYAAIPQSKVGVCFNAANIEYIAQSMTISGMAVVAGDNDHETERRIGRNPGADSARVAAEKIGCGMALPDCAGTDWNDAFCEALADLEATNEAAHFKKPAGALRDAALAKVRCAVMRGVRFVKQSEPVLQKNLDKNSPVTLKFSPLENSKSYADKWRYSVEHAVTGLALAVAATRDEWTPLLYDADVFDRATADVHMERLGVKTHRLIPVIQL
jgi:putative DNA primase/helicase